MTTLVYKSAANVWTVEEFTAMVEFHIDQEREARLAMSLPQLRPDEVGRLERLVIQNILAHIVPAGSA